MCFLILTSARSHEKILNSLPLLNCRLFFIKAYYSGYKAYYVLYYKTRMSKKLTVTKAYLFRNLNLNVTEGHVILTFNICVLFKSLTAMMRKNANG